MKKTLLLLLAALFAASPLVRADTSYLLIQGPFGAENSIQAYLWKVLYQPGSLSTGQDLLNAVFGTPIAAGSYSDSFGGTNPYLTAGNGTQGAGYIQFSFGIFTESFTLGGVKVAMEPDYDPSWSQYAAGGSDPNNADSGNPDGTYPDGSWIYSVGGQSTRLLADGSFSGWVFGETSISPAPLAANFTTATVVNVVPEPGCAALCVFGLGSLLFRRPRH